MVRVKNKLIRHPHAESNPDYRPAFSTSLKTYGSVNNSDWSVKEKDLLSSLHSSACFDTATSPTTRVGQPVLASPWVESMDRIKERALESLPQKLKLEYLHANAMGTKGRLSTRPSFTGSVDPRRTAASLPKAPVTRPPPSSHRPSSATCDLLDSMLEQMEEDATVQESREERLAQIILRNTEEMEGRDDPVVRRLALFKRFLLGFAERNKDIAAAVGTIVNEFDIVIYKLQAELQAEREKTTTDTPSVFPMKDELRQKIQQLNTTIQVQSAELIYHRKTADQLRTEVHHLRLQNERLDSDLRQLKMALVSAAQYMATAEAGDPASPEAQGLAQCMEAMAQSPDLPTASFVQASEQMLAEYRATRQTKQLLVSERNDALRRLEGVTAELADATQKFDKLASVYELQWKDLDLATVKVQRMQEDVNRYGEARNSQQLAENRCHTLEQRNLLLLRELQMMVNSHKFLLARRGLPITVSQAESPYLATTSTSLRRCSMDSNTLSTASSQRRRQLGRIGDNPEHFRPVGTGGDVPVYLRADVPVVNPRLAMDECYKIMKELFKKRGAADRDVKVYFQKVLQLRYPLDPLGTAYSFVDTCTRLAPTSALCWLSLRTLEGTVPEDAYSRMVEEVDRVKAVAVSKVFSTDGRVLLSQIFSALDATFPNKTLERHLLLRTVVLATVDFQTEVSEAQYQDLISVGFGKSPLMEEIRRQFLLQYDEYFFLFQSSMQRMDKTHSLDCTVTLGDMAIAYRLVDSKVSEEELRRRLVVALPAWLQKESRQNGQVDFRFKVQVDDYMKKLAHKHIIQRAGATPSPFQGVELWGSPVDHVEDDEVISDDGSQSEAL